MKEETEGRDYRVFWQSLFNPYSKHAFPATTPLMTLDEARQNVSDQMKNGSVRAWVIDRQGNMA